MKMNQQGKGSRWGGEWAERQRSGLLRDYLLLARILMEICWLYMRWADRFYPQLHHQQPHTLLSASWCQHTPLVTVLHNTTTHFIVCILVSTHASCYCPAQHNHTLYCLHLGVNTRLLLLSCTTPPHTLLSASWCQHMPLVTVLHNTTTHFIVCILVSTHDSCYCPAQHHHTLYFLHLGVNTCLLLLSCTTPPHTLLSASWCQHMPLFTVLHNTTIHTVCILFCFFGCQTNENVGCVLLPSLGIRLIEQEDHITFQLNSKKFLDLANCQGCKASVLNNLKGLNINVKLILNLMWLFRFLQMQPLN